MDWDKLRIFYAVAEAGSFTHAGEHLNLSQSAVSRQVSALEESVAAPLFHRHARGLILTEQGELLYETTKDVFHKLAMAEALLTESKSTPQGQLKITTTVAFGSLWLASHIREFRDRYPEITIKMLLDDDELDLGMREADVAIRMGPPRQPDLIQRPLATLHSHLYAHGDYLARRGSPTKPEDLDEHDLVIYGAAPHPPVPHVNWALEAGARPGVKRLAAYEINNLYGIYRAVKQGCGIAALPVYMAREDPNLTQVLPELAGPLIQAYFVYSEELRHSKRIAVFRDFLLEKVAADNL